MPQNIKPILFSTPMVQAILEGRKTVTRRIVQPQPSSTATEIVSNSNWPKLGNFAARLPIGSDFVYYEVTDILKSKYEIGDVLWVRETFASVSGDLLTAYPEIYTDDSYLYKASFSKDDLQFVDWKWKPSIFMPKEAARIFLKVTNVFVQRLHGISPESAVEEGIEYWNIDMHSEEGAMHADYKNYMWKDDSGYEDFHFPTYADPISSFQSLWSKINGKENWDANPWVWVIQFEVLKNKPANFNK